MTLTCRDHFFFLNVKTLLTLLSRVEAGYSFVRVLLPYVQPSEKFLYIFQRWKFSTPGVEGKSQQRGTDNKNLLLNFLLNKFSKQSKLKRRLCTLLFFFIMVLNIASVSFHKTCPELETVLSPKDWMDYLHMTFL